MDWSKSLYREEWDELQLYLIDWQSKTLPDDIMEWMIKAINRRKQECNCGNNAKEYCISREY